MAILTSPFKINGLVSTDRTVLENLQELCSATTSWLTYDIQLGKWAVIINKAGSSVASFDNSNIIGGINVSGRGISELYNSVSVEFPHADLRDQRDYVDLEVAQAKRYPNEVDNNLSLQFDCINDPVQASYIGTVELKQSRVDEIIEFRSDYSYIGVSAGDLITVTASMYGYSNKLFRVTRISEEDTDDNQIILSITAIAYDPDVYVADLIRTERSKVSGITLKYMNETIQSLDDDAVVDDWLRLLLPLGLSFLFDWIIDEFGDNWLVPKFNPCALQQLAPPTALTLNGPDEVCECGTLKLTISTTGTCAQTNEYSNVTVPYKITGTVSSADINFPMTGEITLNASGNADINIPIVAENTTEGDETLIFSFTHKGKTFSKTVTLKDSDTTKSYVLSATKSTIDSGESFGVIVTTTGVPNGTVLTYTVDSATEGLITSPLTGNVTINNNTGTIPDVTTVNKPYMAASAITVCLVLEEVKCNCDTIRCVTVSVRGIIPVSCSLTTIPIAWCGSYAPDGTLINIQAIDFAQVATPVSGYPTVTVPTVLTVTPGNPSVINITQSTSICADPNQGGTVLRVITDFDDVIPNQRIIRGTTAEIISYGG